MCGHDPDDPVQILHLPPLLRPRDAQYNGQCSNHLCQLKFPTRLSVDVQTGKASLYPDFDEDEDEEDSDTDARLYPCYGEACVSDIQRRCALLSLSTCDAIVCSNLRLRLRCAAPLLDSNLLPAVWTDYVEWMLTFLSCFLAHRVTVHESANGCALCPQLEFPPEALVSMLPGYLPDDAGEPEWPPDQLCVNIPALVAIHEWALRVINPADTGVLSDPLPRPCRVFFSMLATVATEKLKTLGVCPNRLWSLARSLATQRHDRAFCVVFLAASIEKALSQQSSSGHLYTSTISEAAVAELGGDDQHHASSSHYVCTELLCERANENNTLKPQAHKCFDGSCEPIRFPLEAASKHMSKSAQARAASHEYGQGDVRIVGALSAWTPLEDGEDLPDAGKPARESRHEAFMPHIQYHRPHDLAWDLDIVSPAPIVFRPRDKAKYLALSHVWADGTGRGAHPEMVNSCLVRYFNELTSGLGCAGLWWDTISLPTEPGPRSYVLENMHNYYAEAECVAVHDNELLARKWTDGLDGLILLVMSSWFTRGWTAMELFAAQGTKVVVLWKGHSNRYQWLETHEMVRSDVIHLYNSDTKPRPDEDQPIQKDLDVDMLSHVGSWHQPQAPKLSEGVDQYVEWVEAGRDFGVNALRLSVPHLGHFMARDAVCQVRQPGSSGSLGSPADRVKTLSRLLGILSGRHMSWSKDAMQIAGLMCLRKVNPWWKAFEITQRIMRKFRSVDLRDIIHCAVPMRGSSMGRADNWSWCPSKIFDLGQFSWTMPTDQPQGQVVIQSDGILTGNFEVRKFRGAPSVRDLSMAGDAASHARIVLGSTQPNTLLLCQGWEWDSDDEEQWPCMLVSATGFYGNSLQCFCWGWVMARSEAYGNAEVFCLECSIGARKPVPQPSSSMWEQVRQRASVHSISSHVSDEVTSLFHQATHVDLGPSPWKLQGGLLSWSLYDLEYDNRLWQKLFHAEGWLTIWDGPGHAPLPTEMAGSACRRHDSNVAASVNWKHLYLMRRRLQDNWENRRHMPFVIPSADYFGERHREPVVCMQQDHKYLVSGGGDCTIRIWDLARRRLVRKPLTAHTRPVGCLQFDSSPGQDYIFSGGDDGRLILWKFSTGEVHWVLLEGGPAVRDVKVTRDVIVAKTRHDDGSSAIIVLSRSSLFEIRRFDNISSAFSLQVHGKEILYVNGADVLVLDWQGSRDQALREVFVVGSEIAAMNLDCDWKRIVVIGGEGVTIYDRASGDEVSRFCGSGIMLQADFADLPLSREVSNTNPDGWRPGPHGRIVIGGYHDVAVWAFKDGEWHRRLHFDIKETLAEVERFQKQPIWKDARRRLRLQMVRRRSEEHLRNARGREMSSGIEVGLLAESQDIAEDVRTDNTPGFYETEGRKPIKDWFMSGSDLCVNARHILYSGLVDAERLNGFNGGPKGDGFILGWDFCNGNVEVEEVSRFFGTI